MLQGTSLTARCADGQPNLTLPPGTVPMGWPGLPQPCTPSLSSAWCWQGAEAGGQAGQGHRAAPGPASHPAHRNRGQQRVHPQRCSGQAPSQQMAQAGLAPPMAQLPRGLRPPGVSCPCGRDIWKPENQQHLGHLGARRISAGNGPGRPGTPHGATTAWAPATRRELPPAVVRAERRTAFPQNRREAMRTDVQTLNPKPTNGAIYRGGPGLAPPMAQLLRGFRPPGASCYALCSSPGDERNRNCYWKNPQHRLEHRHEDMGTRRG